MSLHSLKCSNVCYSTGVAELQRVGEAGRSVFSVHVAIITWSVVFTVSDRSYSDRLPFINDWKQLHDWLTSFWTLPLLGDTSGLTARVVNDVLQTGCTVSLLDLRRRMFYLWHTHTHTHTHSQPYRGINQVCFCFKNRQNLAHHLLE